MNILLKKAERKKERKKERRKKQIKNTHIRSIGQMDITKILKQDLITKLNTKTNLTTSFYNDSNIISNIDDFNYKSLVDILQKYQ